MNTEAHYAAIESHLLSLGRFDRVGRHEPKNAPGTGITTAIIGTRGQSVGALSGQASSTARVEFTIRLYYNMLQEPQDAIDPALFAATDLIVNAYSGDFTLGGSIMAIDLLGMAGTGLSWQDGYLNQDNTLYRVMDITVPLLIADAWAQAA